MIWKSIKVLVINLAVKWISFDMEMEFGIGVIEINVAWSLDNDVKKVDDILEENDRTGSILQDETTEIKKEEGNQDDI